MNKNTTVVYEGKAVLVKSVSVSLVVAVACSLTAMILLTNGFQQSFDGVWKSILPPVMAFLSGIGFLAVVFLKEWRQLRIADLRCHLAAESAEMETKLDGIKAVYLTFEEAEANAYLKIGWKLLKVPLRSAEMDGQQVGYLVGWLGSDAEPHPRYDSKTRKFVVLMDDRPNSSASPTLTGPALVAAHP